MEKLKRKPQKTRRILMNLYEVTNGYYANENYVRCYAWAKDEKQALELARTSFKEKGKREKQKTTYWKQLLIRQLLDQNQDFPFATIPTNHGWEDVDE